MANLNAYVADQSNIGKVFTSGDKSYTLAKADNFSYTDPVDHSISKNQVSKKRNFQCTGKIAHFIRVPGHRKKILISNEADFKCTWTDKLKDGSHCYSFLQNEDTCSF